MENGVPELIRCNLLQILMKRWLALPELGLTAECLAYIKIFFPSPPKGRM
jgi:hypothetical protein